MVQDTRLIDLRLSYIPQDPNAFPTHIRGDNRAAQSDTEDNSSGRVPIMPYDGYNFMPTPQGYSSFFGTNTKINIDALTGNVDDIFVIQKDDYSNLAVALKDDGIWTKDLSSTGAWTQVIALSPPGGGLHLNWSKCVIDQVIHVYRQGEDYIWIASPANSYVFTQTAVSFLTMSAQLGIFKAGGRLGFWDSANSISWSAFGDVTDHTPSIETLAGNLIFQDIVGKIVTVLQHGDGFVVYATKSILLVIRNFKNPLLFEAKTLFNDNGISYRNEAVFGDPDTSHFANTTTGLVEISNGEAKFTAHSISRYFKEKKEPMYLNYINGKFLFFNFINPYYNVGRVTFAFAEVASRILEWSEASALLTSISNGSYLTNPSSSTPNQTLIDAVRTVNANFRQIYLNGYYAYTDYKTPGNNEIPIYQNKIASSVPMANLAAFKPYADLIKGSDYFFNVGFTQGEIVGVSGASLYFIPAVSPDLLAAFDTTLTTEPNNQDFYAAQDAVFYYEGKFYDSWEDAIYRNTLLTTDSNLESTTAADRIVNLDEPISETSVYDLGIYSDLSFYSERDKYYGTTANVAWLQRSLVYGRHVKIHSFIKNEIVAEQCIWKIEPSSPVPGLEAFDNQASVGSIYSIAGAVVAAAEAWYKANGFEYLTPLTLDGVFERDGAYPGGRNVYIEWHTVALGYQQLTFKPYSQNLQTFFVVPTGGYTLDVGKEVYITTFTKKQTFSDVSERIVINTCTNKEVGFTEVIGYGHYDSAGNFIQDSSNSPATDYVDMCSGSPPNSPDPSFNGNIFTNPNAILFPGTYTIGGTDYTVPVGGLTTTDPSDVDDPQFDFNFQSGSIEPLYPTWEGAFIYDTHLQKWGKLKLQYKNLFDAYPVNTMAGEGIFPYENFLPRLAARLVDGTFPFFDEFPSNSEICYGKVGYYRKGFTDLEEIVFHNRDYRDGTIVVEPSIDSRSVQNDLVQSLPTGKVASLRQGFNMSARWYNIVFKGQYDLTHIEVRTVRGGRR